MNTNSANRTYRYLETVACKELHLYYQFQYDLETGKPVAAEALLRATENFGKNIAPMNIIDEAEQNGSIGDITYWAINQALNDFHALQERYGIERVAINISPSEIMQNDLVETVKTLLKKHKLPGHCLELEITERLPLVKLNNAISTIEALSEMDVRVVLDDFGTGYTALPMLVNLPVHGIKLDRTFCMHMEDVKYRAIAESLVTLTKKLGISLMIEGIENEEMKQEVLKAGYTIGQGYFLHRPQSKGDILGNVTDIVTVPYIWTGRA